MDSRAFRYLPVTGSAINSFEAAADGKILPAIGHGVLAGADAALVATGLGVAGAVSRGTAMNTGKMTGEAVRKQMKRRGVTPPGYDLHHSIDLNGIKRTVENWRNHPAFMKPLPRSEHKRLRGRDGDLPEFNAIQKLWVGTPAWMKLVPAGILPRAGEGVIRAFEGPEDRERSRPIRPAPYGERPLR